MRRENIKNDAVISTFISHQPLNSNRKHVVHSKMYTIIYCSNINSVTIDILFKVFTWKCKQMHRDNIHSRTLLKWYNKYVMFINVWIKLDLNLLRSRKFCDMKKPAHIFLRWLLQAQRMQHVPLLGVHTCADRDRMRKLICIL